MRSNLAFCPRGAQPPTREGPEGPTGPAGWVGGWVDAPRRVSGDGPPTHPLQPLQGLRGPLRWWEDLAGADPGMSVGTRYYPPGIPSQVPTRDRYIGPLTCWYRARTRCTGLVGHAHMTVLRTT